MIMIEVEAKVRLTPAQVRDLRKRLPAMAKRVGESRKTDWYFGDWRSYTLRIRKVGDEGTLTFKKRSKKGGMEANEETEVRIDDVAQWKGLLSSIGFPMSISKVKISEAYVSDRFQIEINRVTGLGYFLEIETLVGQKSEVAAAKRGVGAWFKRLGFSPKDFERKLYLELLAEKGKNSVA